MPHVRGTIKMFTVRYLMPGRKRATIYPIAANNEREAKKKFLTVFNMREAEFALVEIRPFKLKARAE